jgi:hypothetical protein
MKIRSSFEFCKSLGEAKIGILSESQNYRKKKKEKMEDINKESNHEKLKYLKHDCSFIEKSEELNLNKKSAGR